MLNFQFSPIAYVTNTRKEPTDDNWGAITSTITLADEIPTIALENIELFSHLEIIYHFHLVGDGNFVYSRHPRGNTAYPEMGILAQRNKDRPNYIGLCTVELVAHDGRTLIVKNLDAIDGTPILDIKPVFKQFQPQSNTKQPAWVDDLTKHYW